MIIHYCNLQNNAFYDFITYTEECMFPTMMEEYKNLWASTVKLTIKEASTVLCSVVKHAGSGRA